MRFEMQKSGFYNTNYQEMLHEYMKYTDKQYLSLFLNVVFFICQKTPAFTDYLFTVTDYL